MYNNLDKTLFVLGRIAIRPYELQGIVDRDLQTLSGAIILFSPSYGTASLLRDALKRIILY